MALLLLDNLLSLRWLSFGSAVILIHWLLQKRLHPPGPRGLPIVDNLFDIPGSFEHVTFAEWGKKYGDVTYVSALGKQLVVLNSIKAGNELLDKRSAIYSNRPSMAMIDLMGLGFNFGLKPYSSEWKHYRRLFSQYLHPNSIIRSFAGQQMISTNRLLKLLLKNPENVREHIMYHSASVVLGIAYGYDVRATEDPLVALAGKAVQMTGEGLLPKYLPNIFPPARYIPEWFPGNRFKPFAKEAARIHVELQNVAFDGCVQKMRSGHCPPCFVQAALENGDEHGDYSLSQVIKEVSAIMYEGGVDTTGSAAQSLIIQLILHPDIQQRAHSELDKIIGSPHSPHFRFPRFEDRPVLPYIDALCQEILRFRPPVPRGVPHASTEDDIYRGWKIPKGALIIPNAWGMSRDETVYANPDVFNPDRFIETPSKPAEPYPTFAFGFGRRICPGRALAEHSLWIQIASLLAAFQFTPPKDKKGNDINIEDAAGIRPGFIHDPGHIPCAVRARSKFVEVLIEELEDSHVN